MNNSQSATERIKNSLSYKLGFAILEHKKWYKRGYLILIYKLYKIKKQYFKDQKLYKQIIKIFPQLTYSKLESCSDYNESIKYKYHLSYMLGEVLIHAHKTWYRGGYFKLHKNIQTVKMQYNLLKELSLNNVDISLENKELLINNFEAIKDVLQTHKDYKPILENIFHNFKFFLTNSTLIKEWLLSDDFYQKYKKENHPYPSLLDPKKLNNDTEEINYKNIPAELAWEMNLPLPDKYDF
ncbi:capsular biosynthesis protein, partial [Campylobacter coli]|nr:capsular biosynthesis protein [Campylobacter coli]